MTSFRSSEIICEYLLSKKLCIHSSTVVSKGEDIKIFLNRKGEKDEKDIKKSIGSCGICSYGDFHGRLQEGKQRLLQQIAETVEAALRLQQMPERMLAAETAA